MMACLTELDAHEQPSTELRTEWKGLSRLDNSILACDPRVDDPRLPIDQSSFVPTGTIPKSQIEQAYAHIAARFAQFARDDANILHHPLLPGL